MLQALEIFFRLEVRQQGEDLRGRGAVTFARTSDTHLLAYVKTVKVTFNADAVAGGSFTAACTCRSGLKGLHCKHMWAVLLEAEIKQSDFLQGKKNAGVAARPDTVRTARQEQQKEFRKLHYQKQKLRQQNKKLKGRQPQGRAELYPAEVARAFKYFSENGFSLADSPGEEALVNAKRKLARVFHPDRGGSHQEALDLNANYLVLLQHFKSFSIDA